METTIERLKEEVQQVLTTNILPYWIEKMQDRGNGGFYGRITGQECLVAEAEKGAVMMHASCGRSLLLTACCIRPNIWKLPLAPNVK